MLSKLLRTSCKSLAAKHSAQRFKELHEYLCLREIHTAIDGGNTLKTIEAAGKKYSLTLPLTLEYIYYLQNDPNNYHAYLNGPDLQLLVPFLEGEYEKSPMKSNNMTLAEFRESLWNRYPGLVYFLGPSETKLQVTKELEDIFVKGGPAKIDTFHNKAILDCMPYIRNKLKAHVEALEKTQAQKVKDPANAEETQKFVKKISKLFEEITELIDANPSFNYGRLRAFLQISRGEAPYPEPMSIGSKEQDSKIPFDFFKNEQLDLPLLIRERNLKLQEKYERRFD